MGGKIVIDGSSWIPVSTIIRAYVNPTVVRLASVEGIGGLSIARLAEAVGMSKSVLFTRMSGSAARNDLAEIEALSNLAMKPVAYVAIAATSAFVALGPLITEVLFGNPIIGHVLQVLAIGLVGFSQAYVLNRTSFALQDARGPFTTQLVIAGLSTAGSAAAVLLPPELTVVGIAAGTFTRRLGPLGQLRAA